MTTRLASAIALILLLTPCGVAAEDLTPPPWRGAANTTFQHWWFPPGNFGGPAPDAVNNPFGPPTMIVSASDWRATYRGAAGVWRLSGADALIFTIPNTTDGVEKEIWTQVTYHGFFGPPAMSVTDPATGKSAGSTGPDDTVMGEWVHRLIKWGFIPGIGEPFECPAVVRVVVTPNPGSMVAYIDQIVIDTICRPKAEMDRVDFRTDYCAVQRTEAGVVDVAFGLAIVDPTQTSQWNVPIKILLNGALAVERVLATTTVYAPPCDSTTGCPLPQSPCKSTHWTWDVQSGTEVGTCEQSGSGCRCTDHTIALHEFLPEPPVGSDYEIIIDPQDGVPEADEMNNHCAAFYAPTGVDAPAEQVLAKFGLRITGANPFRAATGTAFAYDVPVSSGFVKIAAFDASGRRVATFLEGRAEPGTHAASWRGPELERLASGVYFLQMQAGDFRATERLVLIK